VPDPGTVPVTTIDLGNPDFVEDPYLQLRELQDAGPVVYHRDLGHYCVTRWTECIAVLGDAKTFGADATLRARFNGGQTMVGVDDDRHTRLRGIWGQDFRRPRIAQLGPLVESIVDEHLLPFVDSVTHGGCADIIGGAARAIPAVVIAALLGLPDHDYPKVIEWSERMVGVAEGAVDPSREGRRLVAEGMDAVAELNDYLRLEHRRRRGLPGDDLIARLIRSTVAADMTERDIVASYTQLLFAGNETTPKLMGNVVYALDLFPSQRALLANDRSLLPQAVEEVNRWCTPAQVNRRIVCDRQRATAIAGVRLEEGDTLLCLQGIANRDPRRWSDADRFDVLRPSQPNLGFGWGIHTCLGLHLARLETQVWLGRLLDLLPNWSVTKVDWGRSWVAHGPTSLAVAT
jgi:cytochrome P450